VVHAAHEVRWLPLQVVQGDVTKQQVSGIVNPTNTSLSLAGRVSSRIAFAMGPGFQQTCDDFLASLPDGQRSLAEGSSAVTQAGRGLLCQYIIHAAGPMYHGKLAS
jgi:O-acetyl-ADP-ribose deacetylase (regulator of RNase III)